MATWLRLCFSVQELAEHFGFVHETTFIFKMISSRVDVILGVCTFSAEIALCNNTLYMEKETMNIRAYTKDTTKRK
jgi:hypothetical protein